MSRSEQICTYAQTDKKKVNILRPKDKNGLHESVRNLYEAGKTFSILGSRNSFGDVFIPEHETCIDITDLDRIIGVDWQAETITVESGVRADTLARFLLPKGFYVASSSGSPFNTVAGDISSNVNGKDSWKHGNYGNNVVVMKLMLANGEMMDVDDPHSDLFRAVVSGLGMIAIIVEVTLRIRKVVGSIVLCQKKTTQNLSQTIWELNRLNDTEYDFGYAWTDSLCSANKLGRSVLEFGLFTADKNNLNLGLPEFNAKRTIAGIPEGLFWPAARNAWHFLQKTSADRLAMSCLNGLKYHLAQTKSQEPQAVTYGKFQYPMFSVLPNWNKRFQGHGMKEMQCLFAEDVFEDAFYAMLEKASKFGVYSELCALRKHQPDKAMLSFAGHGFSFTLNYDLFNRDKKIMYKMERALLDIVISFGGKVYLSKFPWVTPSECAAMYPCIAEFKKTKIQFDPNYRLATQTSARLLV